MAIIKKKRIPILTDLLLDKGMSVFHACQLEDFESYLALEGIPSRSLLEFHELDYTSFQTDSNDKENEVWDKVFVNLSDFGNYYGFSKMQSEFRAPIPTIYGPIALRINPRCLNRAKDICLSLVSAGKKDFSRNKYGIPIEDIEKIFVCIRCTNPKDEKYIKSSNELKSEFDFDSKTLTPEINASFRNQLINIKHVHEIIVDPILVNGYSLYDEVQQIVDDNDLDIYVSKRKYLYSEDEKRRKLLNKIAHHLSDKKHTMNTLKKEFEGYKYGTKWINKLDKAGLDYNLNRYLDYLKRGTIDLLN